MRIKQMKRLTVWLAAVAILILIIGSFGYFVIPKVLENQMSERVQEVTGYPVKVNVKAPFHFIFSGKLDKMRVYSSTAQVSGLVVRQVDLEVKQIDISFMNALRGKNPILSIGESSGTCVVLPSDINNFLKSQGKEIRIDIKNHEVFVSTYMQGIGKIIVLGRIVFEGSNLKFIADSLIEPKLISLLMKPERWKGVSFNIDLSPVDEVLAFEKTFIEEDKARLYFKVKENYRLDTAAGGGK